jgi:predicted HTH transcriptional regulator
VLTTLESLRAARADLARLLESDETTKLEFKSSLRTPVGARLDNRPARELKRLLEGEVIGTIAAFLNTEGGTLLIGVTDDRAVIGIEVDYPNTKGTRDGWRRTFDDLLSAHLGTEVLADINLELEPWNERTVAIVRCAQREGGTWLGDELFVRRTASTAKLSPRHAVAWCERWK